MSEIKINEIKLNYKIEEEGFPLIFLHGLFDDLDYWIYLDERLSELFKVIKIDLRGHGKSELGNEKLSMELMADDIYKLIKHLGINECYLVGFSLGGCISLCLAEKYLNLLKNLF